jgi:hypothetical protein
MSDFRANLSDPVLTQFFDYWVSLCGKRAIPSRKDIDPLRIPRGYLPDLMLIDVLHDPRRYRYRLVGTNVVAATGEDRTGRFFDSLSFFQAYPLVLQQYETVVETARPLHSLEPFTNPRNATGYEVDRLLLPLSTRGHFVDAVLVLFRFKTGPHARLVVNSASEGYRTSSAFRLIAQ